MCENRILMQLLIQMGSKDVNGLYRILRDHGSLRVPPPMSPPGNKALLRVFKGLR